MAKRKLVAVGLGTHSRPGPIEKFAQPKKPTPSTITYTVFHSFTLTFFRLLAASTRKNKTICLSANTPSPQELGHDVDFQLLRINFH